MASNKIPNVAAVLKELKTPLVIQERSTPTPGPGEILVLNYYIAGNPVDYLNIDPGYFFNKFPNVLGSDVCGTIVATGPSVNKFKVGERVAGYALSIGNNEPDQGAFQTYTILQECATVKIPDDVSFAEGAVLPMGVATATHGLFDALKIKRPAGTQNKPGRDEGILIWGAASSVGQMCVQIAKEIGFTVFATASQKNHDQITQLGADVVIDYKDSDVVQKLVSAAKDKGVPINLGYVAVISNKSPSKSAEVVLKARTEGQDGKLALTLPWPEDETKPESGVDINMVAAYDIFIKKSGDLGGWMFNEFLADALEAKTIVPAPKPEVVGNLEQAQEMIDLLKKGVSSSKLVLKVNV